MMKSGLVLVFLASAWSCRTVATTTCQVEKGHRMYSNSGKQAKLDFPCKYNFIRQTCGDWEVRVTPGNEYLVPHYIINTIWISIKNLKSGDKYEGRTSNKIAIKHLRGDTSAPFSKKNGNLATDEAFDFQKDTNEDSGHFLATSKDNAFTLTFAPYVPGDSANQKVLLSFSCNVNNTPPAFPDQLCGGLDSREIKNLAIALGFDKGGKVDAEARDKTVYYKVFTDTTTNQSPEPVCQKVIDTMVTGCGTDAKRVEAIDKCYKILYSRPHRQCVTKYSCKLIDAFYACVRFVCSDFQDDAACQELGDYIDMCRKFPGLSDEVAKCYRSLYISLSDRK